MAKQTMYSFWTTRLKSIKRQVRNEKERRANYRIYCRNNYKPASHHHCPSFARTLRPLFCLFDFSHGGSFLLFYLKTSHHFRAETVDAVLLLTYGFLRFIYSLGIQLPGKEPQVLLPVIYSLALGYAAATGAVA